MQQFFPKISVLNSIAFFAVILTLSNCKNDNIEKIRNITYSHNLPVERGSNIEIIYTDSGYTRAKVYAPQLERFDNDKRNQSEMKMGITAFFYDNKKRATSFIKAKYGLRDERERVMTAKTDVMVVNNKGDTLRTDILTWDEKTNLIHTHSAVKITTPDEIIYGDGLESNAEFTKYKIFKIKGIISLKK